MLLKLHKSIVNSLTMFYYNGILYTRQVYAMYFFEYSIQYCETKKPINHYIQLIGFFVEII
jgi:hypothetical protein